MTKKECEKQEDQIDKLKHKVKEIKKEVKKVDEKDKKISELTDSLQRMQAEFENYKRYVEKQKAEFVKYAKDDMIVKLLPLLDSFEIALRNTQNNEKFVKGVELIFGQLYNLLVSEGLRPIECLGKKFDPYKHEVLLTEESDKEEGTILDELQKGYMLGEKIVRHSKVKITKNGDKKTDNAE
ncbi:MAG: nucleotide exchange factor GrpE [Nanoarchaeota archaeon]|nr:nucleotide exchange factor GrpE [Nanoarchaeota archaeon]